MQMRYRPYDGIVIYIHSSMFNVKMACKSRNMSPLILKNKIILVLLDYILSLYLIIRSEHNGDALPKIYKHTKHD
jgi:hypothetical protein